MPLSKTFCRRSTSFASWAAEQGGADTVEVDDSAIRGAEGGHVALTHKAPPRMNADTTTSIALFSFVMVQDQGIEPCVAVCRTAAVTSWLVLHSG